MCGRSPESPRSRWVSWAAFRRTARSRTGIRTLLVAHAAHIYQIAIIAGWSHARIAVTYWFAMAVCGAIAMLVSRDAARIAPASALAAMTGLAIALDLAVRHGAEIRGILKP